MSLRFYIIKPKYIQSHTHTHTHIDAVALKSQCSRNYKQKKLDALTYIRYHSTQSGGYFEWCKKKTELV